MEKRKERRGRMMMKLNKSLNEAITSTHFQNIAEEERGEEG